MGSSRIFRVLEASVVALFFIQAVRVVFAVLLGMLSNAVMARSVSLAAANAHLVLLAMLVVPWFAPRSRGKLPQVLLLAAVGVFALRIGLSLAPTALRLYSGLGVIGLAALYFAALMRANWRAWVAGVVVSITLEQLLRARDTFDLSLRVLTNIPVGEMRLRMPVFIVLGVVAVSMVIVSLLARRSARLEPYEPAHLSVLGGIAFGSFLALELLVLSMANVVARWADVSYTVLVPWLLLATALPLMPGVRMLMGDTIGIFDDRLRGWVWTFLLLLMLVVGNRLSGLGAAGALIVAQFMAVLSLYWVATPPDPHEVEQVGSSLSLGLIAMVLLIYAYSVLFELVESLSVISGQSLLIVLVAGAMLALPRILWREDDPWLHPTVLPRGLMAAFAAPVTVFGLIISGMPTQSSAVVMGETARIATYNINGGYDVDGRFQLELIAKTIETSLADIVVLQEADAGSPLSYGIDEVEYLARRLGMYHIYHPTSERLSGVAILSRWPISAQNSVLFPSAVEQTGAASAVIADPYTGRTLLVVGTQLEAGAEELRRRQLAVLFTMIDPNLPTVLAADLRAGIDDSVYRDLTGGSFLDPDLILGIEHGYTTPAHSPTMRHDFLLIRGLNPRDTRQVDSAASDHRLVVVEIAWP